MGAALVVGGGSGIGRACAERLAEGGRAVGVVDLRRPQELPAGCAFFAEADARDGEAVDGAFAVAEEALGPVDGVLYAAGTARVAPLLEVSERDWRLVVDVNLTGAFVCLRAAASRMVARGGGAFVAVSSIDAQRPVPGLGPYCAAKAGVESLVRVAAVELGPAGVRVNAVAPGIVDTPLVAPLLERPEVRSDFLEHVPLRRLGAPRDVAEVVAFLLSDAAAYVTGQTLAVDGGMSQREHARVLP